MKLSIVILCWNDRAVISDCLRSIYVNSHQRDFEVIVSDNGSVDGSPEYIRANYPQVHVIENHRNLRFAKANNVGIQACRGEYVLILNPDTIIHEGTLETLLTLADTHKKIAAFGCKVLNANGSYQVSARPFASIRGEWITAFYLRWLAFLSDWFLSDSYVGWKGSSTRTVDWISGCFMLIQANILKTLGGFDEQFFYYYEDMDLCRRLWRAGHTILFTPNVSITHLKGQSTNHRLPPIAFALDSQITRYRYYYKYEGKRGVRRARRVSLVSLLLRRAGYTLAQLANPTESKRHRLESLRVLFDWHWRVDPVRLIEDGIEPDLGTPVPSRVLER